MLTTFSKIAALVLALVYVVAAWASTGDVSLAATVTFGVLVPLTLIWFPKLIESWSRWKRGLHMHPSPSWLVALMGWIFLVGVPLFLLLRWSQ
jgi:hypothetical protein